MTSLTASVCLATYNGRNFVGEQIDSILAQLRDGDELIVSDDGSDDGTKAILHAYGARLRIVSTERAGGVVPNFERAMTAASGRIVVLSDQDDVWLPGRLEMFRSTLQDAELVMSNAFVVDGQLRRSGATLFDQIAPTASLWRSLHKNTFVGCCMAFRSELLRRVLPFPAGTPWHDWLIGLLACARGRVTLVSTPYLLYRRHGNNFSATGETSANSLARKLVLRVLIVWALLRCLARRPGPRRA